MKTRSKVGYIAMGVLIAFALNMVVLTALAAGETRSIAAFYNDIKIVVDGVQITPKDANGNVVEPFVYNGTTYLPVRAVGSALGLAVDWDGDTGTVFLGGVVKHPAMELPMFNRPFIACSDSGSFKSGESNGHNTIGFSSGSWPGEQIDDMHTTVQSVTYPLNGVATNVEGTILPPSRDDYGCQFVYRFYNESGKLLYTSPILIGSTQPIPFEVSVVNALSLRIELTFKATTYYLSADCLIQDMTVTTTDY